MRGALSVRTRLGSALLWGLAAGCAGDTASPPLLVRALPAEYFLIGDGEEHDSAREFQAECAVAGIVEFDRGTLDEYTGLSIATSYFRRYLRGSTDSMGGSRYGPVRLARDAARPNGGVQLELPPHDVLPAVIDGVVDRDSTFRGLWPCGTATVPGAGGAGDTTFSLTGRWALCPDSAHCSLAPSGSGGGGPPGGFEFPSLPGIR